MSVPATSSISVVPAIVNNSPAPRLTLPPRCEWDPSDCYAVTGQLSFCSGRAGRQRLTISITVRQQVTSLHLRFRDSELDHDWVLSWRQLELPHCSLTDTTGSMISGAHGINNSASDCVEDGVPWASSKDYQEDELKKCDSVSSAQPLDSLTVRGKYFLDTPLKLRKSTVNFFMSVRTSARNQSVRKRRDFHENVIFEYFSKICREKFMFH